MGFVRAHLENLSYKRRPQAASFLPVATVIDHGKVNIDIW